MFENEQIKIVLYNTDCFELLKSIKNNSIDLVLIDPPYAISKATGFQSGERKGTDVDRFRVSMDFGEWDKQEINMGKLLKECYRVLRAGGTIICFYDIWKFESLHAAFELAKFKKIRFIEWIKTNPVPLNSKVTYLSNAREAAISAVKRGGGTFHSQYDKGIYEYPIYQGKERFHPTQKPLRLIEDLIEKHSNKGDLVLDCFSGSGTTAVGCIETNRNFIGCEKDESYFAASVNRIESLDAASDVSLQFSKQVL